MHRHLTPKMQLSGLVLLVLLIGCLHMFTPGNMITYHDTYRRLGYFPIVVGALWFGLRGGLGLALLSSVAFIPHLIRYAGHGHGHGFESAISELMEIVLYLAAGLVTGTIAGRQKKLRDEYRQISEKLKASYSRLHRETEQLIEAEEQLAVAQKMSALGSLSASLAHEIKNPLSSIRGTTEILLDDYPEEHPKREFVEILLKESDRLAHTVDEVLNYSRGQQPQLSSSEPLGSVLNRVNNLLASQLSKQHIELNLCGLEAGRDFPVQGDKIQQVLLNILLNSVDALQQDGRIEVRLQRKADGIEIMISDNGSGIAEADVERIFAPFYSDKESGNGLGLTISRKIVESFGGSLTAGAGELGGAAFTIFLPNKEKNITEPING